MKAYNIAASSNIQVLTKQVNLRADEGWELCGNTFIETENGLMCQWMVKEVQEGLIATDVYNAWKDDNIEEESFDDSEGDNSTSLPDYGADLAIDF